MFYESKVLKKKIIRDQMLFYYLVYFMSEHHMTGILGTRIVRARGESSYVSLYSFGPLGSRHILWNLCWFAAGKEQVGVRLLN